MNVLSVVPNTPEWMEIRALHDTASEAPAAHGVSKYTSRTDLMRQKATGLAPEVGGAKQAIFNRGHEAEASARSLAEDILNSELYPATANLAVDGLALLASLDGATMDEEIIWEHKLYSESLAADVRAGTLDPHYTIQLDQQLLVSGAKKCMFMTSDGTKENMVWCWYESSQEKFDALIAGWKQFRADLAAYVPAEVIMPAVAAPQMGLPAVSIQVNGSIALVDNLQAFGTALTAYVERINKEPETDQDFADLEATVKALKAAEEALDAAENGALAQTESIDSMRRTVGLYRETARTNRLLVEKLVKVEKENRRTKIIGDAVAAFHTHMRVLNERLGKPYMPTIQAEFQQVVKGLKSLDSMKDKIATELARCKIESNATADKIQTNLNTLRELAAGHAFLFSDTSAIVLKANDDLVALVKSRIADHKAIEEKKEAEQRERIRAEEVARMQREQAELDRATAERAAAELKAAEAAKLVTHEAVVEIMMPTTVVEAMKPAPACVQQAHAAIEKVAPMPIRGTLTTTVSHPTPPDLRLGQITERLGFALTAAFLSELGFEPAGRDRAAVLYHSEDFQLMGLALIDHIYAVCELQAA